MDVLHPELNEDMRFILETLSASARGRDPRCPCPCCKDGQADLHYLCAVLAVREGEDGARIPTRDEWREWKESEARVQQLAERRDEERDPALRLHLAGEFYEARDRLPVRFGASNRLLRPLFCASPGVERRVLTATQDLLDFAFVAVEEVPWRPAETLTVLRIRDAGRDALARLERPAPTGGREPDVFDEARRAVAQVEFEDSGPERLQAEVPRVEEEAGTRDRDEKGGVYIVNLSRVEADSERGEVVLKTGNCVLPNSTPGRFMESWSEYMVQLHHGRSEIRVRGEKERQRLQRFCRFLQDGDVPVRYDEALGDMPTGGRPVKIGTLHVPPGVAVQIGLLASGPTRREVQRLLHEHRTDLFKDRTSHRRSF